MNFQAYSISPRSSGRREEQVERVYDMIPFMNSLEPCQSEVFSEWEYSATVQSTLKKLPTAAKLPHFLAKKLREKDIAENVKIGRKSSTTTIEPKSPKKECDVIFEYTFEIEEMPATRPRVNPTQMEMLTPARWDEEIAEQSTVRKESTPLSTRKVRFTPTTTVSQLLTPERSYVGSRRLEEDGSRLPFQRYLFESGGKSSRKTSSHFEPSTAEKTPMKTLYPKMVKEELSSRNFSFYNARRADTPLTAARNKITKRPPTQTSLYTSRRPHACAKRTPSPQLYDIVRKTLAQTTGRQLYFDDYASYLYNPI
eukprot:TRINITY_DN5837_c0_g1_i3.p1 TRINITY_DN5837_c0_g1~~TRINITY_DN5837_c0_g1_i3.p1  ORF type:complete len:311 (+),score=46.69 TRINITY_DN5837_c0_g1_i3:133-1065(+)